MPQVREYSYTEQERCPEKGPERSAKGDGGPSWEAKVFLLPKELKASGPPDLSQLWVETVVLSSPPISEKAPVALEPTAREGV